MKQVIMTVGLPFSGKSTVAEKYKKKGWKIIERDEILRQIQKSPEYNETVSRIVEAGGLTEPKDIFAVRNKVAPKMLGEIVRRQISEDEENIFYDGTNLQRSVREEILKIKEAENIRIEALVFDLPMEQIRKNADKAREERRGEFNEGAYKNLSLMQELYEKPSKDEGFDEIKTVTTNESNREFKQKIR